MQLYNSEDAHGKINEHLQISDLDDLLLLSRDENTLNISKPCHAGRVGRRPFDKATSGASRIHPVPTLSQNSHAKPQEDGHQNQENYNESALLVQAPGRAKRTTEQSHIARGLMWVRE